MKEHQTENKHDGEANSIWCKICGITSAADAVMVEQAGADAIGLNFFASSPRFVTLNQAAAIAQAVSLTKVGLFVDAAPNVVEQSMAACQLDLLQFHGDESPDYCAQFGMPYMKVLRVGRAGENARQILSLVDSYADGWACLLDAFVEGQRGGTGKLLDRALWPQNARSKLILAGGLNPQNVGDAILQLSPHGVDVSSGVEHIVGGKRQAGKKDEQAVRQFISEVNDAAEQR
ncbi:MAG: phosphoribosylanthranilate isomerase [Limisphaerales bacterium]|jgi:phosphoribosylanthranilate isomerase